ncbi:MAG: GNAT family N-acetyltransferase [Gemmatimonadetes bacterium]|nr:GNAT family N-acetyltransferase [Gemmatimonadota bacterium]
MRKSPDAAGAPTALTIAPAAAADLGPVLDLLRRSRLPEVGLADHIGSTVVAKDRDRVVGSAALELYGTAALLRSVAVDERLRGNGVGRRLTESALDLARSHGVRAVYLLTETAPTFFARLGFTRIERDAVDPAVRQSVEFTSACPSSATAMRLSLESEGSADPARPA